MREILFKAKRVDGGEWVEGSLINNAFVKNNGTACMYIFSPSEQFDSFDCVEDGVDIIEVDPETVCQFTGLLDKNGKKIFEGDVVIVEFYKDCRCSKLKEKAVIKFYSSAWCTDIICHSNDWLRNIACDDKFEIIGNIHDKKEGV